ncbi:MAG TPA: hypothetical protein ENF80_01680 [Thermofilum sp.]|nr:hypothetical protein [Thermofilum sp.]
MVKRIKTKIPVEKVFKATKEIRLKVGSSICLACRGAKLLCGKSSCPVMIRLAYFKKVLPILNEGSVYGASPPEVFVGWKTYPNVYVGPLVPPNKGDTSLMANPSLWLDLSISDIAEIRTSLIRESFKVHVRKPWSKGKLYDETLEVTLSSRPAYVDAVLERAPKAEVLIDSEVQPMGPLAPVKSIYVTGARGDRRLEKVFYDYDLKASDAIRALYAMKTSVYSIVRLMSIGGMGIIKNRKLVPTRWSITAVDDTLSRYIINTYVKKSPLINEYKVYEYSKLGNKFIILMLPHSWEYESIEAWFPGTLWNPDSRNVAMIGDWEGYHGRTNYASMGGCYYAARLAVTEKLKQEGRQAAVLVLREIYGDYIMPLGVWLVREMTRKALSSEPTKFGSLEEALEYVFSKLKIPRNEWVKNSLILSNLRKQVKITNFL